MSSTKLMLKEIARRHSSGLDPKVKHYIDQMVSPLLGPIRKLNSLHYDAANPTQFTFLPELSDIHRRAGLSTAPQYHLSGYGFSPEEALMRALGESVERSALITFHLSNPHLLRRYSHQELANSQLRYLSVNAMAHFTPEQRRQPGFPFVTLDEATPISWIPGIDLRDFASTLLPIQALITGFTSDEPRAILAVSTGTAAHTSYERAFLAALLELLQLDAAMGHWYSHATAPRIDISASSAPRFARFVNMYGSWLRRARTHLEFYWLQQPDNFPAYTVACALRRPNGYPAMAMGLGVALDPEQALYSALIEAVAVSYVGIMSGLERLYGAYGDEAPHRQASDLRAAYRDFNPQNTRNFDDAVGYYTLPEHMEAVFPARFDPERLVGLPDITQKVPPLPSSPVSDQVMNQLLPHILQHHRLYAFDLSAVDSIELGFRVVRLYSPDLLPLCFPSFPMAAHPRFNDYGGFHSSAPHPYP